MINKLIDSHHFPNNFFDIPVCENGAHFVFSDEGDSIERPIPIILSLKVPKNLATGSVINPEDILEQVDSYSDIKYLNRNHLEMHCLFKEDKIIFHKESDEIQIIRPENLRLLIPLSEDQMSQHISNYFTVEIFNALVDKTFRYLKTLGDISTIREIQEDSQRFKSQYLFDYMISKNVSEEINNSFIKGEREINRIKLIENLKDQRDQYMNYLKPIRTVIRVKN